MAQTNAIPFSAKERYRHIQQLKDQEYDLLVIGGGITGAGIALDAATRGFKVALVEKKDFAWGTSSRSTKLVHGGLRYLKQMEFKLVKEVGTERAIVHNNARHIVIPERMLLPIIKGGSLGKTMSSMALWVYDWLAGVKRKERKRMLNKKSTAEAEPLLRTDILKAGGLYYEYRTDDARLTIEVLKTAVAHGAIALNYIEVRDFEYDEQGQVRAAIVNDLQQQEKFSIQAECIVNAAGPWVDTLRKRDSDGVKGKRLHLSKGVHIVVDYERLPLQQSVYFDVAEDKRMIFAIPRGDVTYLGTTDTNFGKDINEPNVTKEDVKYILEAANFMFPDVALKVEDVQSSWSGLRPLIHQDGKSVSELSRKDEIFHSNSGLISIAGGKLTGYRKMAERVVNLVSKQLGSKTKCKTKKLRLSGGDFESNEAFHKFITLRAGESKQILATPKQIRQLAYRYGSNIEHIIDRAFDLHGKVQKPKHRLAAAELWYAIENEQVLRLSDFLIRRSGRLYFERPELENLYLFLADQMAQHLSWTEKEKLDNIKEFEKEYHAVLDF